MSKKQLDPIKVWFIVGVAAIFIVAIIAIILLVTKNSNEDEPVVNYTKEERAFLQVSDSTRKMTIIDLATYLNKYLANNRGMLPSSNSQWDNFSRDYLGDLSGSIQIKNCDYSKNSSSCTLPTNLKWSKDKDIIYIAKHATCDESSSTGLTYSEGTRRVAIYSALALEKYYCYSN